MASNIITRGISVNALMNRLNDLAKNEILVGIPQSEAWVSGQAANNALLGYIHEFGSPANNIPARPFLIPSIEANKEVIANQIKKAANLFMENKEDSGIRQLEKLGGWIRDSIKSKIGSNIQPALSPLTIAARNARHKSRRRFYEVEINGKIYQRSEMSTARTNTLIDTGAMQQSVNYVRVK